LCYRFVINGCRTWSDDWPCELFCELINDTAVVPKYVLDADTSRSRRHVLLLHHLYSGCQAINKHYNVGGYPFGVTLTLTSTTPPGGLSRQWPVPSRTCLPKNWQMPKSAGLSVYLNLYTNRLLPAVVFPPGSTFYPFGFNPVTHGHESVRVLSSPKSSVLRPDNKKNI